MCGAKRREGSKAYADDTLDHLLDLSIPRISLMNAPNWLHLSKEGYWND